MSKKHFIAIAADINEQVMLYRHVVSNSNRDRYTVGERHQAEGAIGALQDTAQNLATTFADFSSGFDRQRFLSACGF